MRANEWMDVVSERLQRQWPTVDPARLDDVAADLWADEKLRSMAPLTAADEWLRPVANAAETVHEQGAGGLGEGKVGAAGR